MKSLQELINTDDPAWDILNQWIKDASNKVEVLPRIVRNADTALTQMQVSTRSFMGAVIYETGGILVDNGWIRLLGSGSEQMKRSLPEWNKGKAFSNFGDGAPYLLVADDAIGGLFAINGGFLGSDAGSMYYFASDALEWFPMEVSYTDFLLFCFEGKLDEFYEETRWDTWKEDVPKLAPDSAYSFYPFLWTDEGKDVNACSRKIISMDESYEFLLDMKEQIDKL